MRFTLRNLGRLQEATIDLSKDLILLTGPNNTSKTYMAYSIYGFTRKCDEILRRLLQPALPKGPTIDVVALLQEHVLRAWEKVAAEFRKELADIFAADEEFCERAEVVLSLEAIERESAEQRLLVDTYHMRYIDVPDHDFLAKKAEDRIVTVAAWAPNHVDNILSALGILLRNALWPGLTQSLILPAERSAVQLFSHELSLRRADLVDSLLQTTRGRRGSAVDPQALLQRARRYSMPIRDSLRAADDLAVLKRESSSFAPLADRLEQEALQGALRVDEEGALRFQPEGAGRTIDLNLSSSSVKALAGLSLYLRHAAAAGQFLIIDEPELNLHPDNQRRVARLLARLSRSGIKVMVSTHSDYIIREINNLIMLSADQSGALRAKYGYAEEETLTPKHVGAYLFGLTSAQPLPIEPGGFSVKTIDDEIHRLNTSSQDIYFELFGGKA